VRTVVFDLDGTLVDTSFDMIAAANASLAGPGVPGPLDPVADAETAFAGGRAMLRLGLSRLLGTWTEADIDARYPGFLRLYADGICRESRLYPGAREAVAALAEAGLRLAICTNKPAALAEALMRALDFRSPFGVLVGADTLPVRKPDPAPLLHALTGVGGHAGAAMLLGDTITDVKTARAAGVPVALVGFGPAGARVAEHAPDAILPDFAELPSLVGRLLAAGPGSAATG